MITIYPEKHCALTMLYPNIVPEARFDKNRISNKNFAYPAGGGAGKQFLSSSLINTTYLTGTESK